ncbi:MAG TPA: histidine phosphatase family protein [Rhodospirillaceae bacterium]|nr:histidine phosphatase family protein [Magnetovibrio sp.]HBT42587.1 histidine phosphatase family protein [Rhodospirillaceae bacterium]HCS71596.1 histidine phosphatase family protein [Rhodospirillaceae bacterium]|tara:strand:+ start:3555 stop:4217 length:663 start_codon:yes stop_codon:yes gene_type:complete
MKLLLVRHGNTFETGETPVRVGANEDLPLTAAGEDQAHALAAQLKASAIRPDLFVCGPLKRTRRHTEIVMADLAAPGAAEIDPRLTEIDYGAWGGMSDGDIVARFGPAAARELDAWEKESRWPTESTQWMPGAETVMRNLRNLTAELAARLDTDATALVCSSNGILRYFLEFTPGGLAGHQAAGKAKMATGAASLLDIADGEARVLFWNVKAGMQLPDAI